MMVNRASLWVQFITIVMVFLTFRYYTTVLHPPVVYPPQVQKIMYLDEQFTEIEKNKIKEAAQEWSQATDGRVVYTFQNFPATDIDYPNSIIVLRTNQYAPEILELDFDLKQFTIGFCNMRGNVAYIGLVGDRLTEDDVYRAVMLHELGHSLGLPHNQPPDGIGTLMYPALDQGADYITHTDLVNFCELYNCDATDLHDQKEPFHP
jgi:Matrixin